jgi:dihydrofolate reductase
MDIVLVAAVAANGTIGRGNALPWRLKSDLMNFRAVTMGKPLIMGRKTYQSLGRQLKGRTVIVVSRDRDFAAQGVVVAPSFDAALAAARGDALRRGAGAIIIAGGADIYAQALPLATRLLITEVHKTVEGDVHFPAIDPQVWRESARNEQKAGADDDVAFAFVAYERAAGGAIKRQSAA